MANKNNEKVYPEGLFVDQKETNFGTIDKLSIQADKFIDFLNKHKNAKGYVNIDLLNSQKGGKCAVLNSFVPKVQVEEDGGSDLPF